MKVPSVLTRRSRGSAASGTIRLTEMILGLNIAMSAAEALAHRSLYTDDELLTWRVARTRHRRLAGKQRRWLDRLMGSSGVVAIQAARLGCAVAMVLPQTPARLRATAMVGAAAGASVVHIRSPYGSDGSEHLSMIVSAATAGARLVGQGSKAEDYALKFIAAQVGLSYIAAGLSKAYSPSWRMGDAVRDILRTRMYGHQQAHEFLAQHRWLGRAVSRYTIGWETLFPLVFVAPAPVAAAGLAHSAGFHVANAYLMGLNRFLPAFLATYPAVAYATPSLRPHLANFVEYLRLEGSRA